MTRLNKHIALVLGISRREADSLIEKGSVTVNGETAQLGQPTQAGDTITVNGGEIAQTSDFIYVALNKPSGYVCSRRQQGDSPTIYSLLPPELQQLKTVGRLDRDSSGLILLTNDGDFAHQMTHPSFSKIKIYEVQLDKSLEPLHQQMISDHGIRLEDGVSKFLVEKIKIPSSRQTKQSKSSTLRQYKITMSQGRNRQIRRTFGALGYTVTKLHRIQFGNFSLENLKLDNKSWRIIEI